LAPFRPPGWGSVGCRTFVELNLSGALDARHHLGDLGTISGGVCQLSGTNHEGLKRDSEPSSPWARIPPMNLRQMSAARLRAPRIPKWPILVALLFTASLLPSNTAPQAQALESVNLNATISYSGGTGSISGGASGSYESGASISITATPTLGSTFAGWSSSGPCNGTTSNPCTFTIDQNVDITAIFTNDTAPTSELILTNSGSGSGVISGPPTASYGFNTVISLVATPDSGNHFTSWVGGPCDGSTSLTCNFALIEDTEVTANFDIDPWLWLGVQGTGAGSITGGATDTYTYYPPGTELTITAVPVVGESKFSHWVGDACDGSTSLTCTLIVNTDMGVYAEFAILLFAEEPVTIAGRAVEEDEVYLDVNPEWTVTPDAVRYRWYRCSNSGDAGVGAIPEGCAPISRATTTSYVVTAGSVGSHLRLMVTATRGEELASSYSATMGPAESLSLELTSDPFFSYDTLVQEELITAQRVTYQYWTPSAYSVTFRWYRCTSPQSNTPLASNPVDCVAIAGTAATSQQYRIGELDQGLYLGLLITAGRGSIVSTAFVGLSDPVEDTASEEPELFSARFLTISGDTAFEPGISNRAYFSFYADPSDNQTFEYFSFPRVRSIVYSWYRCATSGGATRSPTNCSLIRSTSSSNSAFDWGAGNSYYFSSGDVGYFIRLKLEIFNGVGSDYLYTATTEQITGPDDSAPTISADPQILSDPWEAQWVDRDFGTYSLGYPTATLAQSWYACTSQGGASDDVPDDCVLRVRSYRYKPISADVGMYLRIRLDLSNVAGDVTAISATSAAVQTLTGPPIPDSYPTLCYETVDGFGGGFGRFAFATGGPPSVCGRSVAGKSHYGNGASWSSGPRILAYSFGWLLCSSAQPAGTEKGDCRLVNTRTGGQWNRYIARASDVGRYLRLSTTALNRYGKTTAYSRTYLINLAPTYQPARLLFFPRILEEPVVGLPLWEDGGAWQAYGGMPGYYARVQDYRILWLACTSEGGEVREIPTDCTAISESEVSGGEVPASEYVPRPGDVGYYLRVAITANSVGGPSTAVSATTEIVGEPDAVAPTPLEDPAVFLEEIGGTRYFTSQIEWDGYPLPATSMTRWYRCTGGAGGIVSSIPGTCTAITGASGLDYEVVADDVGKRLRVAFTAATSSGTTTIVSATSDVVPALPTQIPTVSSPPLVSGLAMVSLRLVGTTGSWTAIPANMTYTYRWYSCTGSGVAASALPSGCTGLSTYGLGYVPVRSDRTKFLRLAVTATNTAGSATHWSAATAAVVALSTRAPIASGPPCVDSSDSDLVIGTVLSRGGCSVLWSAYPAVVGTSSSWWSCAASDVDRTGNSAPTGCRRVQSNRPPYDSAYTSLSSDLGRYLRLAMTATNKAGKATVWSSTIGPIVEAPPEPKPIIIFAPELYDTPEVGEWFWQDGGAWIEYGDADYPPISGYNVEWLRCTTEGADSETRPEDCVGATGSTADAAGPRSAYLPTTSDVGWYLRVGITASNRAGSTTWYSGTSPVVPEPPRSAPELVSAPEAILWEVSRGSVRIFHGVWSGYPAVSPVQARAYRCTGDYGGDTSTPPENCLALGSWLSYADDYYGYETVAADTGMRIRLALRAENTEGVTYWFSETSLIVPNLLPSNPGGAGAPAVSVTVGNSSSLSAWGGSWSGYEAPELTYAWYSCTSGGSDTPATRPSSCSAISGATSSALLPQNLGGKYVRVAVTGTNSRGTATRFSTAYGPIVSVPTVTTNPVVSGTARVGRSLSASTGTWTGSPTFSYQWFRCTSVGRDNPTSTPSRCTAISGATLNTYQLSSSDAAKFIRVRVTGTNISGSKAIFSQSTAAVTR